MVREEWQERFVKDLMKIETGSRNTEDKQDDGQYPFYVRSQTVEHIDSYHYDCEAVLTAGDGVGTGKVFHYITGKFDAHQRVYVMSQFKDVIGKYFYYWFSKNFYAEVIKYTAKSSVDSVRRQMIADMVIPLPEREEQEQIARILSDVDLLIDDLKKLIRKKKDIRQGTMQTLMTGEKRLLGYSKAWKPVLFSEVCTISAPMVNPKDSQYAFLPHIGNESIEKHTGKLLSFNRVIDDNLVSGKYFFTETDVLYGKINPQFGKVAFPQFSGLCSADMYPITCKEGIVPEYLKQVLLTYDFLQYTIALSLRSGMPKVNRKELADYRFSIPEIEEQRAIAEIFTDMDKEIYKLEEKLSKYQKIKQGMMEELLTGKVRLM